MIITPMALACIGFLVGLLLYKGRAKYQDWKFAKGLQRSAKLLAKTLAERKSNG